MTCSNCLEENDTVKEVCKEREYNACSKCTVTYGKNRKGDTFFPEEQVYLNFGGNYVKLINRPMIIEGVYIFEESESGRMVLLKDIETNKTLTHIFDINWLIKIKN
jgi:hypothetical protein